MCIRDRATRIHLFGASGCGATTLGAVLGERLDVPHLEADNYYWVPTDPPFTDKYPCLLYTSRCV